MISLNISFLGAGKVASSLAQRMIARGYQIERIVSPGRENGEKLAEYCSAQWSDQPSFPETTELIITAVPDTLLKKTLSGISCNPETIVVHTAASFGLDVFPENLKRNGVFYPLQTFSADRVIDFTDLPFLLEASDDRIMIVLSGLAEKLGGRIYPTDTANRMQIHAAAVFICNFTNHMLTAGKEVADHSGIPFDIFLPLIRETVAKAVEIGPEISQTGPAIRNDLVTIEKHLEFLSFSPDLQSIYREMTASIIKYYKKN